ncbi:MAG TPA: carboxypeptidase-like regulatory domain-containing protein [Bryobacteraceae bacterium]|nr:carboxypeptidase-like regulatory domain-containing protein [Bryobacteraceae bacterium]
MRLKLFTSLFLFLAFGVLTAQEFRATLTGRIVDASGGGVPNAAVTIANTATNDTRNTSTDGQGNYTVPLLPPGSYSISAEAPGFKKTVVESITLQMSQTAAVNLTLEVGAVTDSVSVTAEAPLLDTAKADRGAVIDTQRIHELPINGRNPFLLGAMIAGVNFHGAAIWQRPFDNGAIADWTINGGQQRGTEFLLDGAPNNGQMGGNNIAYVPPVDSVQEFKIHTNTYDAQYGHTNGGIINVTTKGGANDLHGSAYGFFKRTSWNANLFQNNAKNQPRPQDTLDWLGIQASGPVFVPKVFDGRNKLFFMVNYEDYKEKWPQKLNLSVPAPEFAQGDFSKLVDKEGKQIRIFDPLTATTSNPARTQFPGNMIPASRLNPIAQKILGYYAQPNSSDPGKSYSDTNYVNGENFATDDFYNLVFKFDTNLGEKDRFFFRHASNDRTEHRNENGAIDSPAECCQLPFQRINDHVTADWVRTVTPRLIVNVRGSYNRFIEKGRAHEGEAFDPASLGWSPSVIDQLPNSASVMYFPKIQLRGAFNYADLGRYPGGNTTNTYAIHPSANWIPGAHAVKFGLDYRFTQYSAQDVGDIFRLQSTRRWTRERWDQDDPLSGNPVADFVLGLIDSGEVNWRQLPIYGNHYWAPYIQDDWKVNRRLNLNLGLRWDINAPPQERFLRGNYIFDPNATPDWAGQVDTTNLASKQIKGGLTFLGGNNPNRAAKTDWNNLQPRVGMAYQVSNKIVARAGWGVFYVNPNDNWHNNDVRQGFDLTTPFIRSNDGDRTPVANLLSNPFASVLQPKGAAGGLNTFLNRDITFFDPNFVVPYVHQFSAGFQFELPYSSVVEISYVGNRTKDLQSEWDGYNSTTADFRKLCNPFEGGDPNYCNQTVANPFKGIEAFRGTNLFTANTISRYQANRPFPQFNRIRQRGINPGAIWYNSMQIQHQTRFRGGLNLLTTYTLSKQIERWGYIDQINEIPQQGLYTQDRPHRFTLAGIWKLPIGKGQKWGSGAGPVLDRIIGGWEVTSFLQLQSGRPWDLPSNVLMVKDPKLGIDDWLAHRVQGVSPCVARYQNAQRAFVMQGYSISAGCTEPTFYQAPDYTDGRITPFRSGQIRLHTAPNLDASVNKSFRIKEGMNLQFRAEAFNLTNTYFWGRENFINDPNNQNFGAYFPKDASDQNRYPRQVQLALKFIW